MATPKTAWKPRAMPTRIRTWSPATSATASGSPIATTTTGTWSSTTSSGMEAGTQRERFEAVARSLRDLLAQRWLLTAADLRPREPQAGLLPVDGVPDRPVAGEQHHQPAASSRSSDDDLRRRTGPGLRRAARSRSPTPGWATAASAGWPPASSTRWRRCRSRRSATACATSTASSARRSRTAGRSSSPTTGCAGPTRGRWPAPDETVEVPLGCSFEAARRHDRSRSPGGHRTCSASPTTGRSSATAARRSTRCGSGGPRRRTTSTSASSAAATSSARSPDQVVAESLTRVLYPDDSTPRGRALRFVQEYFLVACSLADIVAPLPPPRQRLGRAAGQGRHPAQRHPPGAGRRRADAHPARRGQARLGRGLGPDRPDAGLHQPHAAARGAGEVAGRALRGAAPAAPGDHLRDQPPVPRRRARALPRRRGAGSRA